MRFAGSKKGQDGLVSLVVVSIIIIVLSIVTIGFARIMDRQLRQQLDNELSIQAHYAAESGLNDARVFIPTASDPSTSGRCLDYSSLPGGGSATAFVPSISGSYSGVASDELVKYSCVIIDSTPRQLIYDIRAGQSRVFKMVPGSALSNLFFSWENSSYSPDSTGNIDPLPLPGANGATHPLPKEADFTSSDQTGMLRVTLYPVPATAGFTDPANSALLANASRTYFLYPNGSGSVATSASLSAAAGSYASDGTFINGGCNKGNRSTSSYMPFDQARGYYCNSELSGVLAAPMYYLRLTALYQNLSVAVQGSTAAAGSVTLGGAEAVIDVTGEGNDILKRQQARVPYGNDYDLPVYSLQTLDTICKRFGLPKIGPNSFGPAETEANGDATCTL